MPPQEFGIAAPRAEDVQRTGFGIGGGFVAGVVEGSTVQFAKGMGALEPIFSWGVLIGVPAVGVAGALLTRGMISDAMQGVAAGGTAILGYSLPAMLMPEIFTRKAPAPGARELGGGNAVKLLGAGPAAAAAAAAKAAGVRSSVEF